MYGKSDERSLSSSSLLFWTVLGGVASVVGVILTIVFRIKDKRTSRMKGSNRPAKG